MAATDTPTDRMFGIKLIYPDHLRYPHLTNTFPEGDSRVPLMNFKNTSRNVSMARAIPTGHRSLVFTKQRIVWAIEFTGPLDDGSLLAAHGVKPVWPTTEWSIHRPIRFLARMNVDADNYQRSMHRREIAERSGVNRRSYGQGHIYITEDEYRRMYDVVPWDWTDGDPVPKSKPFSPVEHKPAKPSERTEYVLPPIPDAESYLSHIRSIAGQPERNMEDAVKEFLVMLGHEKSNIRFQVGRIDVTVSGDDGQPLYVCEVKRTLSNSNNRDDALRKGFDYAGRLGARYVVITDADSYEVYDRTLGLDHASMRCAAFQLTALKPNDLSQLDVLKCRA